MKLEIRSPGSIIVNNLRPTCSSSIRFAIDNVFLRLMISFCLSVIFFQESIIDRESLVQDEQTSYRCMLLVA